MLKPPNEVARVLMRARERIADSNDWWDGSEATVRDKRRLCLIEALGGATHELRASSCSRRNCVEVVGNLIPAPLSIPAYNDSHTHEEVLALLDRAIQEQMTC